eukprot:TRINITY_DN4907_c0_g2_i1.p1 TRINITY_DN4907_c0_g2~~TRINITY_DN4907_c0_g2_i1.p1  ORF type:complete len:910 (+),score=119.12 TRINITY_DN4907_c0_g2_i1:51-2780(+)
MPFPPFTRAYLQALSQNPHIESLPSSDSLDTTGLHDELAIPLRPRKSFSNINRPGIGGLAKVEISSFPEEVQSDLKKLDNGDGLLDAEELGVVFLKYQKLVAQSEEGVLRIRNLPKEVQPILQVFDVNGDGTISVKEISKAADLFEASQRRVRNLVRISGLLLFAILLVLAAIGVLTFYMIDIAKTSKVNPGDTVETVVGKEGDAPTAVAVAGIIESRSLFDAHTETLDALKAVKSLTLNSKDGTQTFSYTIIAFKKESLLGAVTFYSSRGDEVRCTGSDILVTSSCEVPEGQSDCTGAVLLSLSRADLQAQRRLLEEKMEDLIISGRRLRSTEIQELQRHLQSAQDPASSIKPRSDKGASKATLCPDGTAPVAGECPEACEGNMPQVCPPSPGEDCLCPALCDAGKESCYIRPGTSGWTCSSIDMPFQSRSTGCIPVCSERRNLTTGQCLVTCSDGRTVVPESEAKSACPLLCPDLRGKASRLGLTEPELDAVFGVAYTPASVYVTGGLETDAALEVMCPKLCKYRDPHTLSGVKVIQTFASNEFACPQQCAHVDGVALKDKHAASSVYSWPDEECPKVCPQTGSYVQGIAECPIYCPDLEGRPIERSPGVAMTFFAHADLATGSSTNALTLQQTLCPEPCMDGTYDWAGTGCQDSGSSSSGSGDDLELVDCPGKPTNCDGQVVQMTHPADCPLQCATLRNCNMKEPGLIYPDSGRTCPIPCYRDSSTLLLDDVGNVVFDMGYGCPSPCPSYQGVPEIGLAPQWICPVVCLNSDSTPMMRNGRIEYVYPVKEKTDPITGKKELRVLAASQAEIQARMCPIRCNTSVETFVDPYWAKDADGFWLKSHNGQDFRNCPTICEDGSTVMTKYGGRCGQSTAAFWAGRASKKAGYHVLGRRSTSSGELFAYSK